VPAKIDCNVGFWFSFNGEVIVCMGFFSMNTNAVSGRASSSVLPMNVCRGGPWRAPGKLKNIMMTGCMSGAMLPNNSAGKYT
jgi:hypothetical protein